MNSVNTVAGIQRQTEGAARAHHGKPRCAVQLPLKRDRDLLLDFLGGKPGRLGDDLRRGVGHIEVRLDRKLRPAVAAIDRGKYADHRRNQALAKREVDQPVSHRATLRP